MTGHTVRTPRTDCPETRRRTHSLSIESVRPVSGPREDERIGDQEAQAHAMDTYIRRGRTDEGQDAIR